jgi:hypothetical protein
MEARDILLGNRSSEIECNLDKIIFVQCKNSVAIVRHLHVAFGLMVISNQPLKLSCEVLL